MKTLIYSLVFSLLFLIACTGSGSKTQTAVTAAGTKDSAAIHMSVPTSSEKVSSTTSILSAYLDLKNAFTADNDKEAAAAGNELVAALASFDKTSLTAEQSQVYADIADDAKEHGEHIAANIGNIIHQREHFDMLSKGMYDLVKLLGTSKPLYVDHCPMYNNKKGAIWLSELKAIKNPYFGNEMPTCGTVKEELK